MLIRLLLPVKVFIILAVLFLISTVPTYAFSIPEIPKIPEIKLPEKPQLPTIPQQDSYRTETRIEIKTTAATSTPTPKDDIQETSPTSIKQDPTKTPTPTTTSLRTLQRATPTPTKKPSSTPAKTATPTPTKSSTQPSLILEEKQQYILSEINKYRATHNLPEVKPEKYTCSFAAVRSKEIASDFSHVGWQQRVADKTLPFPSYSYVNENLAMTSDYKRVVPMWIASSGHAKNMRANTPYVCVVANGNYYAYEGWRP